LPGIGLGRDKTLRNRISTPTKKNKAGTKPEKTSNKPQNPFPSPSGKP